tara:strand:- start:531 stop:632 length:102 start_codon:yes stop_codon:yes gene_type:complete
MGCKGEEKRPLTYMTQEKVGFLEAINDENAKRI